MAPFRVSTATKLKKMLIHVLAIDAVYFSKMK